MFRYGLAMVIGVLAIFGYGLSGCNVSTCDCIVPGEEWEGSVSQECGPAGGTALAFRFDRDTIPDSSRRYQIYPVYVPMDSLKADMIFTDTLEICEGASCRTEIVSFDITSAYATNVDGILLIREVSGDTLVRQYLSLYKDPNPPGTPCL